MFNLIEPDDSIVLGISGGKDSLCLLKTMAIYRMFSHKNFKIHPVMLDLGFPKNELGLEKIKQFATSLGTKLIIHDSREVYPILLAHQKNGHHIPCSICSRMKKAAINQVAHELGANKVAFAHHRDDSVETLFMNMIHAGRVQTFEPKMHLERTDITFIRPLIFAQEEQLEKMAIEEELPVLESTCPANKFTEREYSKNLLKKIYSERQDAKENFASMLYSYQGFNLYFKNIEHPIQNTSLSVKPIIYAEEINQYNILKIKNKNLPLIKHIDNSFLIYKNKKIIGVFSYSNKIEHEYIIEINYLLPQYSKYKVDVLQYFVTNFEKKSIPCLSIYLPRDKSTALSCSFNKSILGNKEVYLRRRSR